jgi:hypothetical protein
VQLAYGEAQALDRVMYEEEVRREALSFEQQFHYGAGRRATVLVVMQQTNRMTSCKWQRDHRAAAVFTRGGCHALPIQGAMYRGLLFWPCTKCSSS